MEHKREDREHLGVYVLPYETGEDRRACLLARRLCEFEGVKLDVSGVQSDRWRKPPGDTQHLRIRAGLRQSVSRLRGRQHTFCVPYSKRQERAGSEEISRDGSHSLRRSTRKTHS